MRHQDPVIGIIGLGYVGTPLLVAFAARFEVVGFDLDPGRVAELKAGRDRTRELSKAELETASRRKLTSNPTDLHACNIFIVTVPTPVTDDKRPDLGPLLRACGDIGPLLKQGDTVIFESTVYPGATEEVCVPVLERLSGLKRCSGFQYGYSPERINPGDPSRRLKDIVKVVSGCCPVALEYIDSLYAAVVPAGTHCTSSVRVAEAAKVIENTQRDVNIALVNELAMLFDRLGLDTLEVLAAARTKWNFLPFTPGLVGGHCIGVDPYYLTHKAREVGFEPKVILAGRGVNDGMAAYVADRVLHKMRGVDIEPGGARVLVLGLAFKENCPDTRNSQVFRLVADLEAAGCLVDVYDPWVRREQAVGVRLVDELKEGAYSAILVAVGHTEFRELSHASLQRWAAKVCVVHDFRGILKRG